MNTAPTGLDTLASVVCIIILGISLLTLLGMGILMAINAIFSKRPLVTSWPQEQEHSFDTFERRSVAANSQAWVVSLIGAAVVTFVAVGVYFGVTPEKKDVTKDMNMSNLTKKAAPAPTPAPKAEAPAAPAPAAPAEAPKP
jgi:uncharacterized membrane protein